MMKYNKISLGIAVAISAITQPIWAQETAEPEVEKIVVTGQKIDRSIQETANSVAVLTAADIEKQNASNITDVLSSMANVSGDLMQGFSIRGIDAFSVSGGGTSFLTTTYLDGAPLPYRMVRHGALSVWDVSQVEVFRGPQSTLQGRNALAGAVHIRTQDPTYEWGGKAKATFGSFGQQDFAFAGGGALIDNILAIRVSAEDKQLDGDIDNITRGEESSYQDSVNFRTKLLFQPTDNFKAILSIANANSELGPQWAMYEYGDSVYDRTTDYNSHIFEKTDTDLTTLEMTYLLTDEMSLDLIVTNNESEYRYNWDGDMTPEQITNDQKYVRVDTTNSQEFRFTYADETLEAVFGVYLSSLDVKDDASGQRFIGLQSVLGYDFVTAVTGYLMGYGYDQTTAYTLASQVAPLYPDIDPVILEFSSNLNQEVKSNAVFADIKYKVTNNIDLLAGFRFDNEEQKNASNNLYMIANTMPDPTQFDATTGQLVSGINALLNGMADDASGVEPPSSAEFDAFLPKLGISYHLSANATTSLIYQQGYRSGGVGTNIAKNEMFTYEPEYTDNIELSYRSQWMNDQLVINANAFMTQWTDQQVSIQLSPAQYDSQTINAGESEIVGFETEVFYYPSRNLSIKGGLGYAKSEFTKFSYELDGDVEDLTGRPFADAPEWTANVAMSYQFDSGLFTNLSANYQGESVAYSKLNTANDGSSDPKNEGRVLVNLQTGYEWNNYSIRLDVRNLLDEEYINRYFNNAYMDEQGNTNSGQHQLSLPRQFSLTLQAEF